LRWIAMVMMVMAVVVPAMSMIMVGVIMLIVKRGLAQLAAPG
jgi:hypothetical protein